MNLIAPGFLRNQFLGKLPAPLRRLFAASSMWFCCAAALSQTGQITGRVTDPGGAVLPDVRVTVTGISTGLQRRVQSNADGYYTVPSLLPGAYSLLLEKDGFKPVARTGLTLDVDQNLRIDVPMSLGQVSEQIEVSGQEPPLETETGSAGQVVSGRNVVQLPLLGRDAYALGELTPGVRGSIGMNNLPVDVVTTSSISVNGAPATGNDFLLDGAPNSASAGNTPVIYPIADSVQEFKVQTNSYSAEFGRASGGIYNVATKAGTSNYHFTLYEFNRTGALAANNWFSKAAGKPAPPLTFNQFGGVLGGPVILPKLYNGRQKTFFFVGAELVRFTQGNTFTATVPNPTKLTGNFAADTNSGGQAITIYNPFSTHLNSTGTAYIRDPFPGNVIPAGLIDPVAKKMASYFPAPTNPNAAAGAPNYVVNDSNNIQKNQFTVRVDQYFSPNTRMFARYSYDDSPFVRPSVYGPSNPASPALGPQDFNRQNAVLEGDQVFSSTLIGNARLGFTRLVNKRGPLSQGFDISTLGFPAGLAQQIGPPAAFPVETITGYSVSSSLPNVATGYPLGDTGLIAGYMNTFALQTSVTKIMGRHELKAGGDIRVLQANIMQTSDNSNTFDFTAAFTQGPTATQASSTAGDALAAFLLGTPDAGSVTPSPALALQSKYYAAFLQDNWKLKSNFTLNLGVRYEFETPRTERHNQLANFDYNAAVPLTVPGLNLHGALSFVGVDGNQRYQSNVYADHVSPRLGFAWQVDRNMVVSGGSGLFYGNLWGFGAAPSGYGISGFTTATSMVPTVNGVTPISTLSNPYPSGLNAVTGSSLGSATLLGQSVSFYDRNQKTPYSVQWNFGIQHLLPSGMVLDVRYVGTHSLHSPNNLTLNQLPDQDLALGNALLTQVSNPFQGQIKTGALSGSTISEAQLLVPYPQFTAVTSNYADWEEGRYNALEAKLEKRMSSGLDLLAVYTWSKMLDQGINTYLFTGETVSSSPVQDYNNLKAELSPSAVDQTHRVVFATSYRLPFFAHSHNVQSYLLGGWEMSALGSFLSGSPLGITSANNTTYSQGGGQRPDWNGKDPALAHHTVSRWFDTSAFTAPAAFHFGNTPRTFNFLRSDWTRNIDLSVHKNIALTENLNLELRGDAFNMDNTPIFQPPNTVFGSSQFGLVTGQQNAPRAIQLAAKLRY